MASIACCIKVRSMSDLDWKPGTAPTVFVLPHPSLSDEEKRVIIEHIDHHYSGELQIYVERNEGLRNFRNLAYPASQVFPNLRVVVHCISDVSRMVVNNDTEYYLLPEFAIPESFMVKLRRIVMKIDVLYLPELKTNWHGKVERTLKELVQVGITPSHGTNCNEDKELDRASDLCAKNLIFSI